MTFQIDPDEDANRCPERCAPRGRRCALPNSHVGVHADVITVQLGLEAVHPALVGQAHTRLTQSERRAERVSGELLAQALIDVARDLVASVLSFQPASSNTPQRRGDHYTRHLPELEAAARAILAADALKRMGSGS